MSTWSAIEAAMNSALMNEFGIQVTWTPQDGSGAQSITGMVLNPRNPEDMTPNLTGGAYLVADVAVDASGAATLMLRITSGNAVSAARLLVDFENLTPSPQKGDTIQC